MDNYPDIKVEMTFCENGKTLQKLMEEVIANSLNVNIDSEPANRYDHSCGRQEDIHALSQR